MMEYVFVDYKDSYRTGTIVETIDSSHFLIQFDNMDGEDLQLPAEIVSLSEMSDDLSGNMWGFFRTRGELDAWVDHLCQDHAPTEEFSSVKNAAGLRNVRTKGQA